MSKALSILVFVIMGLGFFAVQSVSQHHQLQYSEGAKETAGGTEEGKSRESVWQWLTKDAASFFTFILAVLTSVLAGVSLIQVVYLRRADETARISSEAARLAVEVALKQAEIAERSLLASERAWVSIEISNWSNLSYYRTGSCSINLTFFIKNIGKTPAIDVKTSAIMISDFNKIVDIVNEFSRNCKDLERKYSRLLLPQQNYERFWAVGLDEYNCKEFHYPGIIACVTYTTLPDYAIHQTLICYSVAQCENVEEKFGGPLQIGKHLIRENIRIEVVGGGLAD